MNNSGMFQLNGRDLINGVITALLAGLALPILAALQTPGFDIFTANWSAILTLGVNGAIAGVVAYLSKNLLTASNGKIGGVL